MAQFNLSNTVDSNKVFLVKRSELEGKFEVSYYLPETKKLEDKIRGNTKKKLKDFIVKLSSGATPLVTEEAKFYSDKENGIPFLRVQNLQTNGKLSTDDVKYINQETHNNYLKRSQVSEGDLLIKITGVGRMAIASVAPDGFVGNTNQHMVVIKTTSKKESEYLANYLNLDIVEKLATRRATGGTRPALDYPALKSIPIIENIDFSIIEKAELQKQQKEVQAKQLLTSIDTYLLNELGITLPEKDTSLQSRIFTTMFSDLTSNRFDAEYNSIYYQNIILDIKKSKYKTSKIKDCLENYLKGIEVGSNEYIAEGIPFIRVADINFWGLNFKDSDKKISINLFEILKDKFCPKVNELLFSKDGTIGFTHIVEEEQNLILSSAFLRLITKKEINLTYFKSVLDLKIYKDLANRESIGSVIKHLTISRFFELPIPLPPPEKQTEIANHIQAIRAQAKQLQEEAKAVLEEAKREVEKMILG